MEEGERASFESSVRDSCGNDSFRTTESACDGESSVEASDGEFDENGWILRSAVKKRRSSTPDAPEEVGGVLVHMPSPVQSPPRLREDKTPAEPKTSWVIQSIQPVFRIAEELPARTLHGHSPRRRPPDVSSLRYLSSTSSAKRRQEGVDAFLQRRTRSPQTTAFRFGAWHKQDERTPPKGTPIKRGARSVTPGARTNALSTPKHMRRQGVDDSLAETATPSTARRTFTPPAHRRLKEEVVTPRGRRTDTPEVRTTPRSRRASPGAATTTTGLGDVKLRDISFGAGRPGGHLARPQAFLSDNVARARYDAKEDGQRTHGVFRSIGGARVRSNSSTLKSTTGSVSTAPGTRPRYAGEPQNQRTVQRTADLGRAVAKTLGRQQAVEQGVLLEPVVEEVEVVEEEQGNWSELLAAEALQMTEVISDARTRPSRVASTLQLQLVEATVRFSAARDELQSRYDLSQVCMHKLLVMSGDALAGTAHCYSERRRHDELQVSYEDELAGLHAEHQQYTHSEEALLASVDPRSAEHNACRERMRRGVARHYAQLAALRAEYTALQGEIWETLPVVLREDDYRKEMAVLDGASRALESELDMLMGDDDDDDDDDDEESEEESNESSVDPPSRRMSVDAIEAHTESTPPTHSPQMSQRPATPNKSNLSGVSSVSISESVVLRQRVLTDRVCEEETDSRMFLIEEEACVIAKIFNAMHTALLHLILNKQTQPARLSTSFNSQSLSPVHTRTVSDTADRYSGVATTLYAPRGSSSSSSRQESSERARSISSVPVRVPPAVPQRVSVNESPHQHQHQHQYQRHAISPGRRRGSPQRSPQRSPPRHPRTPPHGVKDIRGRTPPHLSPSLSPYSPALTLSPSVAREVAYGADPHLTSLPPRAEVIHHQMTHCEEAWPRTSVTMESVRTTASPSSRGATPPIAEYAIGGVMPNLGSISPGSSPSVSPQELPRWKQMVNSLPEGAVRGIFDKMQTQNSAARSAQREEVLWKLRNELHEAAEAEKELPSVPPVSALLNSPLHAQVRQPRRTHSPSTSGVSASVRGGGGGGGSHTSSVGNVPIWITGQGVRGANSETGYQSRTPSPPAKQGRPFCSSSASQ